jgi:Bacteriophage T4-like portal protein (Gp20)/Phage portal protein, lambda family
MSQFSNYWKIVTPASRKQLYTTLSTDAYDPRTTDVSSLSSVQWYSQVLRGPGSRMQMYKQYDAMDADVDIARSLDIIAEEMSSKNQKTNLPFEIEYQKEDNQDISDSTTVTLRQAARQWVGIQQLEQRVFTIARTMIKYGDCFFRKTSDTKKWIYVDPSLVYGIEVDEDGNKIAYHVKKPNVGGSTNQFQIRNEQLDIIPAAAMIHFTMCDEMGNYAPFGLSILRPIFRVYRQLAMIEDAVVIYRLVRAPERRVFYVDTGNMPPQRVKQYLEQIKNEIRQKRSPSTNQGGRDTVDGSYDAQSIQEDLFFPVTAAGRGSRVETLPGGTEDFGTNLLKYFQEKVFRGLRIPTSYMSGTDGAGAQYNDGKVGIAYIEEMRFANFVMRLQDRLEEVFDQEFKIFLKVVGLRVDDEIFKIRLPDPANFALYRQAALDADLIGSFNNIESTKYLSRRFVLKRYLGLSDDEIQMNEVMIKEERSISETANIPSIQQLYDPAVYENRSSVTVDDEAKPGSEFGGGLGSESDIGLDMGGGGGGGSFFSEPPAAEPAPTTPEPAAGETTPPAAT